VLSNELDLTAVGTRFVDKSHTSAATLEYRRRLNEKGSPSDAVASGYIWTPGTESARKKAPYLQEVRTP
jgi:hypothetical protein